MPLHMRVPKRGFNNPFAPKYAEVNLWRIAKAIEAGKLDAATPMTPRAAQGRRRDPAREGRRAPARATAT
jgi:ribosomal protein L15